MSTSPISTAVYSFKLREAQLDSKQARLKGMGRGGQKGGQARGGPKGGQVGAVGGPLAVPESWSGTGSAAVGSTAVGSDTSTSGSAAADLRARIDAIPGLKGTVASDVILARGVRSWRALGHLTTEHWKWVLHAFEVRGLMMRPDFPEDLLDDRRPFGAGHMNALDELRKQAWRELRIWEAERDRTSRLAAGEEVSPMASEVANAASEASAIAVLTESDME